MRRVALIVGAGDATGGALARRFAREGMVVAIARRARHADKLQELAASINASGGAAHAMPVDARVESDVVDLVRRCEELGELDLVVHNIGANVRFAAHETTERVFRKVWELACLSAFLVGREGSKPMAQRGRGTLIFTGATASVRGASHFSAFSAGMAGKRALSQSLASELGPKGVHVAHVVVDGAIETPFVRSLMGDEAFEAAKVAGGLLAPEAIADTYLHLHQQSRTAWTHELDLRPASEAPWWSPRAKV